MPSEPPGPRVHPTDLPTIVLNAVASYYLAGFAPAKIRQLLEKVPDFADIDGPNYSINNLERTCRAIQAHDRKSSKGNPYIELVMASTDPFHIRSLANRTFAEEFPQQASWLDEDDDISEMRTWRERWREEVRLLRDSPFIDFDEKADNIEKCLDNYSRQLVKENPESLSRKGDSPSRSPRRSRPASPSGGQLKPQQITYKTSKPRLRLTTDGHGGVSISRRETPHTAGDAQKLDADGFLSPRPKTPERLPTPPRPSKGASSSYKSSSDN